MDEQEEGMTDLQFKAYLRSLIENLEGIRDEPDPNKASKLLDRMITTLKSSLEG